jgi:hypothetical protein
VQDITNQQKAQQIANLYGDQFQKSKGEGSKGGKVVGHTKSGKAIYDDPNHKGSNKFDHKKIASEIAKKAPGAWDKKSIESHIGEPVTEDDVQKISLHYLKSSGKTKQQITNPNFKKELVNEVFGESKSLPSNTDDHDPESHDDEGNEINEHGDIKKGGEGSQGGKIIGHTKSGKPIYESFNHPSHSNFTTRDHEDAGTVHQKKGTKADEHVNPSDSNKSPKYSEDKPKSRKPDNEWKEKAKEHFTQAEEHYKTAFAKKDEHGNFAGHDKEVVKKSEDIFDIVKLHQSEINKQIRDTFSKGGE